MANRSYAFNDVIFDENGAAQPQLNTLSVYHGLVGDFPNQMIHLDIAQASEFLSELIAVDSEESWQAFRARYATHRNSASFWPLLDWLTDWNFANRGRQAGHFDLRYYELLDSRY